MRAARYQHFEMRNGFGLVDIRIGQGRSVARILYGLHAIWVIRILLRHSFYGMANYG